VGSPVVGQFTYKVTNASGTLVDLTIAIDLGNLTANTKYSPAI
jgi:hypothetical protein